MIEGSLNSKLPTIWRVEKQMRQAVQSEVKRCTSAKVRRKKIHPRQMLGKLRNAVFFQWFVCRINRKVGLLKRRVRSHVIRGEIKNCTPLWREAHLEVKMWKNWWSRSTFWSCDVEGEKHIWKWKCWNLTVSEHFLKLLCRKIGRRCGEKHVWKWKCTKHQGPGALFEVLMSKNCTPL